MSEKSNISKGKPAPAKPSVPVKPAPAKVVVAAKPEKKIKKANGKGRIKSKSHTGIVLPCHKMITLKSLS